MTIQNVDSYDLKRLELYHPDEFIKATSIYQDGYDIILKCDDGSIYALDDTCDKLRQIRRTTVITEIEFNREFGYRLKRRIWASGMTHKQFSDAVGIGESSISNYCSGKRLPSFVTLDKIAVVLNCSTDEFRFRPR